MEVRVAVVGNVDAGKSTTLGVLTRGALDDGRGKVSHVHFFVADQVGPSRSLPTSSRDRDRPDKLSWRRGESLTLMLADRRSSVSRPLASQSSPHPTPSTPRIPTVIH